MPRPCQRAYAEGESNPPDIPMIGGCSSFGIRRGGVPFVRCGCPFGRRSGEGPGDKVGMKRYPLCPTELRAGGWNGHVTGSRGSVRPDSATLPCKVALFDSATFRGKVALGGAAGFEPATWGLAVL